MAKDQGNGLHLMGFTPRLLSLPGTYLCLHRLAQQTSSLQYPWSKTLLDI
jgi:hypothetical protein